MAVDWIRYGLDTVNAVEIFCLAGIAALTGLCALGLFRAGLADRREARSHATHPSNVVRLVPRSRPYDWQHESDAS